LAAGGFDGVRHRFVQAGEVGYHLADAGDLENAQHRGGRHRQQHRATLSLGPLVHVHQDTKPGGVTEPGPGHVDHERRESVRGRFQQGRLQPGSVGDVDLLRRRHDTHAPDHVNLKHRSHLLRTEHRPAASY
jgi:hypothetical protein